MRISGQLHRQLSGHAGRRMEDAVAHVCCAACQTLERRQLLASSPFPDDAPSLPSETVLFANYDNGGEGVGHHDLDRRNKTREYRRKSSVDVERVADSRAPDIGDAPGVGRAVGHTRAGEWLNYTIDVTTAGTYRLDVRYATGNPGGTAHIEIDGKDITGTLDLSNTGDWQRWRTLRKSGVTLPAGEHTLRFVIDSGPGDIGNLHWFRFAAEGTKNDAPDVGKAKGEVSWPYSWKQVEDAPSPRFEAMSHAFGDKLYVFGGYKDGDFNVDRSYATYHPETNQWKTVGELPAGMAETHMMPVNDGRFIYFVGGYGGDLQHGQHPPQEASDQAWRFDPKRNRWLQLPSLPVVQGAGGTAIVDGKLHVIGGTQEDRVTNVGDHYVLDLSDISDGWSTARPMPDEKDHFSMVSLNGKIYAIAGEYGHDRDFNTQASVHVYLPSKDRWRRLADLPIRSGHAESSTFVHDGHIIFAGGQTPGEEATDRVFAYDPLEDEWKELGRLPSPLQGAAVAVFGKQVVVTQGGQYTTQPLATTYVGTI